MTGQQPSRKLWFPKIASQAEGMQVAVVTTRLLQRRVCRTNHDLVLRGVGHFAVVKVIPLSVVLVLGVAGVCRSRNVTDQVRGHD